MKHLAITANCSKPAAAEVVRRLAQRAAEQGLELYPVGETAALLPDHPPLAAEELGERADLLLALGGDGTMITAVHLLNGADVPVLGVNLGSLGFMTAVTADELEDAVDAVAADRCTLSTRTMAQCEVVRGNEAPGHFPALNDIVIGWGSSARLATIGLQVDGEDVTHYACDGLIVSTPTGSTGHSLSAGGPILHPETEALLVNVICPHALSARPLVLPDVNRLTVTLEAASPGKEMLLSIDGQQRAELEQGDLIRIEKHPAGVRFLHPPGYSYFSVLRKKLHWRGSSL